MEGSPAGISGKFRWAVNQYILDVHPFQPDWDTGDVFEDYCYGNCVHLEFWC